MKYNIITNTRIEWAQKTNILEYGQRQAQSCSYLEILFDQIESRTILHSSELSELFKYLRLVHRRQYADLEDIIKVPKVIDRKSFYFDKLYSAFNLSTSKLPEQLTEDNLLSILAIQAISYLRGKDRYKILKEHNSKDNESFRMVWTKFYSDATGNAEKVFEFIYSHFDKSKVEEKIKDVIRSENSLIHAIWRHKNVASQS